MNITKSDLNEFINISKQLKRHELMQLLSDMRYNTYEHI